jgi:hypothetical protein
MWQISGRPGFLQEELRLKKRKICAVLKKHKNYELAFSDPGPIPVFDHLSGALRHIWGTVLA